MKTITTILAILTVLSMSNTSFAQKRSKYVPASSNSQSRSYDRYSNYGNSQSGWSFGAEIVLNKSTYSYKGQGYGNFSPAFFVVGDYSLNSQIGFIFKLGYDNKNIGLQVSGITAQAGIDYLAVSSLFRYTVAPSFFLAAGPTLNFAISKVKTTISDNTGSVTTSDDADVSTRFALSLQAGYNIEIAHNIELQPTLGYDLFISSATADGNSSLNNLHVGAGLRFKL
ncbi:MAG TPA: hypothetical protein VFO76_06760 [Candidatus Kapabacteria bacterium]|nr:hypothetical protein [Candidatus Kapabacteria bacterium]